MSRFTPRSAGEWGAGLLTWFGMLGLASCFLVWALTNEHIVEPIFVTTFAGLLVAGQGRQALAELRAPIQSPITAENGVVTGAGSEQTEEA